MEPSGIAEQLERHEQWWNRTNTGPVMYIIHPKHPPVDYASMVRPWMSPQVVDGWSNWKQEFLFGQALHIARDTGSWAAMDEALEFLEEYARLTGYTAEGYPFLLPGLGPIVLPSFVTGFSRFKDCTIWVELDEPWEWDRIGRVTDTDRAPYADLAIEGVKRLCEKLGETFVIAMPDLGRGLDVLAAIRGNANLLMDVLVAPEQVQRALDIFDRLAVKYYAEFASVIDAANHHGCYAETMRYLSAKPTHISICDFSAMIGPEQFEQFARPTIVRECEEFAGRVVYHMDGPGQMPHVDHLCSIDKLHAVQWVPGAGNPGTLSEKWYPLYHRLIDAGKRICLGGAEDDIGKLQALFAVLPSEEFLVPFTLSDPARAATLVREFRG